MLKEFWEDIVIKSTPVYSLAECTALAPILPEEEELVSENMELTEWLQERFRDALFLCDEEQLEFLKTIEGMTARKEPFTSSLPSEFWLFYHIGFVHLFSWENDDYLVLPKELADIYHQTISDEDFIARNKYNLEMRNYTNALLNLYGMYEIDWLMEVWNQHHREKITYGQTEQFLFELAYFHSDYYFVEDFVVHECIDEDDFEELFNWACRVDYYMPTKSVIAMYAAEDYHLAVQGVTEMNEFLKGFVANEVQLDNLLFELTTCCERLKGPDNVDEYLENAGVPLKDEEFIKKFDPLFRQLLDNARVWELRGFTLHQFETDS